MKFFGNMFEKWSKRKFRKRCKANIESALMRIEMIRRRRNAMQKYVRSDIAELLRDGFDSDAYGRVGRLYLDQIRSLSYGLIEQFCTILLNHLITMNDQSECPEECREAVSSLTYAAARMADLPELRALRSLFFNKYGDSFESFVNKELVNLLNPDRPTKEMKLQLMQEIVLEHGVEWDCKSLEQKLYKPPLSKNDWSQNAYGDQDTEYRITDHENGWMVNIQETRNQDSNDNNDRTEIEKQTENMRQRLLDFLSRTTSLFSTSRETTTSPEESSSSSSSNDSTKFRLMPPPYVKNDPNQKETNSTPSSNSTTKKQIQDDGNKENIEVSNDPNVENQENKRVKSRRRIKGDAPSQVKSHLTESPPRGPVHPKLPDYDDIIARFAALRAKS